LKTQESWIYALVVFCIASATDLIDGWFARRFNQISEFGKFIDPLADKILVISSVIALLVLDPFLSLATDFWMVIIIAARDILITIMRTRAIKKGKVLRTSKFGKVKTAFQMGSIVIIITIYIARKSNLFVGNENIPYMIMLVMTIMTLISGIRYLYTNWTLFFPEKKIPAIK
jgi:cardiolipin synthase